MRRHGYVPPKYYDASMLLQYAVDSRLDETLQNILTEVMQPPLIRNPFPEVVGRLRGTGHQFDVNFHLGGGDIITGGAAGGGTKAGTKRFTADGKPLKGLIAAKPRVTLVPDEDQPTAIYAARPPASRDSDAACYGLYSAVALCDPVRCSRLFEELPQLFTSRQWQEGPYMYQCIPALGGDASFSAGLGPALEHANKRRSKRDARKRTHTVGFTPVVEERTKVSGPDKARAADIYGTDVVRRLIQMQTDTPWLVHDIMVPRGVLAAAGAAAARRQLEAEQRLAEEGKMPAHLDDRPGTAAASDLLSRMGSVASTPAGVDRNGMGPVPPRGAATGPGTIGGAQTPARGGGGGARRRRRALLGRGQRVGSKRHARAGHHPRALGRDTRQPARRGEDRVARRAAGWRGLRAPVGQVQGQVSSQRTSTSTFVRAKGGADSTTTSSPERTRARRGDAFQG